MILNKNGNRDRKNRPAGGHPGLVLLTGTLAFLTAVGTVTPSVAQAAEPAGARQILAGSAAARIPGGYDGEAGAGYRSKEAPTLQTPVQLREYLQACLAEGVRNCVFFYTGDRADLEGQLVTRMTNALYCRVRVQQVESEGETEPLLCETELVPHAGEAILDAWRAGDLSALSEEELEILEQALGIVDYLRMEEGLAPLYEDDEGAATGEDGEEAEEEEPAQEAEETAGDEDPDEEVSRREYLTEIARRAAEEPYKETGIGVELRIHDWLCGQVEYCRDVPQIADTDKIPPQLSVVGALRDGSANCQGYADAFFLLGSLAGYEVSFQSAEDRASGTGHVFNTIRLEDRWYAVDVTGDDNAMKADDLILSDYHLFNAGMDIAGQDFTWPDELTIHPIAETSDHYYYYYWDDTTGTDGYRRTFDSAGEVAAAAVDRFREGSEGPYYYLLKGHEDRASELDSALTKALKGETESRTYHYYTVLRGGSTYYRLEID